MLFDILGTVLENRGIKDVERFLNPSISDVNHYSGLLDMDKAVQVFVEHEKKESRMVVIQDSDGDGWTSACATVGYIRRQFPHVEVEYLIHEERVNGLTEKMMSQISVLDVGLVIVPDAGSNDQTQIKELQEKGIDVIVLDHHAIEEDTVIEYGTIINPQLCLDSYPNDQFSGVGITYKFLQALDDFYGLNGADEYLDLVAIGNISDSVNQTQPETRHYIYKGLSKIKNPFFKELVKKNADWADEIYPSLVSWQLVNHLNAIIRVGSMEEKLAVFRAMLGEEDTITRISKYRGIEREVTETLPEQAVRLCVNARSRQNRLKRKLLKEASQKVEEQRLDRNAFIILTLDKIPSGFSGFLAGDIAGTYRRPTLVMSYYEEDNTYNGSLRAYSGGLQNVKSFLEETGLFNWVRGHEGAAGVSISAENLQVLDKVINKKLQFEASENLIPVDFEISSKALTVDLIEEVASYERYFGKNCEPPSFAITGVEIDCSTIQFSSIMKTMVKGVELLSFNIDKRLQDLAMDKKLVVVDIVGELGLNHFNGNITPQVKITAIDIKQVKDKPAFTFEF